MTSPKSAPAVVRIFPDEWLSPISLADFSTEISKRDIHLEYRVLRYLTENQELVLSLTKYDHVKDRYRDIRPFSSLLLPLPFYINASLISSPSNSRAFIACQAPLPKTIKDFWEMVFLLNVKKIVCLSKCEAKCIRYWPENKLSPLSLPEIEVSLVDESHATNECQLSKYFLRIKKILNQTGDNDDDKECLSFIDNTTSDSSTVELVQFNSWPDHGVPDPNLLPPLIKELRSLRANCPETSPVVVHCSAGVGRTGCLLAIHNAIEALEKNKTVSILQTVLDLRKQRPFMVQTTGQYHLIYDYINDLLDK